MRTISILPKAKALATSLILTIALTVGGVLSSLGQTTLTFTANDTWTVPAGVTTVDVNIWGGGGAGGGTDANVGRYGGGGGGGAFTFSGTFSVVPGEVVTITIGAGGVGVVGANGGAGGTSSFIAFNGTLTANGGAGGGLDNTGGGGTGGAGGAAGTFAGGNGAAGVATSSGGGGGGAGDGGAGGNSAGVAGGSGGIGGVGPYAGGAGADGFAAGDNNGAVGTGLAAGGSGARNDGAGSGTALAGGDGYQGQIIITFCEPPTLTLTSAVGTDNQFVCINNSITNIVYTMGGSANTVTGGVYPLGVSESFSSPNLTISGIPTVAGVYNYTVTTDNPGCGTASLNGTITVEAVPSAPTLFPSPAPGAVACSTDVSATLNAAGTGGNGIPRYEVWTDNGGGLAYNAVYSLGSTFNSDGYITVEIRAYQGADGCAEVYNAYTWTTSAPTAQITAGSTSICQGTTTNVTVTLTGVNPWDITIFDATNSYSADLTILSSPYIYSVTPLVSTTYTITFVDDAGSCTGVILPGSAVIDVNTPPIFTMCPDNDTIYLGSGFCTQIVDYSDSLTAVQTPISYGLYSIVYTYKFDGATLNPGWPAFDAGTGAGSTFNVGTTTVTIIASDGCSPDDTCTFTITLKDVTPPVVAAAPSSTTVNCEAQVLPPPFPTANDDCDGLIVGFLINSPNLLIECQDSAYYRWSYTDNSGNVSYWTFTYYIDRIGNPIVPVDGASTVECVGSAVSGTVTVPTVTSQCGEPITPTGPFQDTLGTDTYPVNCEGTISFTWFFTDCSGNSSSWTYTYTIDDTQAPNLINVLNDCSTLDIDSVNECLSVAALFASSSLEAAVAALYEDNCDSAITVDSTNTTAGGGNSDCAWVFTYEFTITDCAGNTTTCDVVRSGGDTEDPELVNPIIDASSLDSTGSNVCLSVAEAWDYTSIYTDIADLYQDNCASPVTVTWLDSTHTPGNTDCAWSIKYRYTIADGCTNSVIDSVSRSGGDTGDPELVNPIIDASSLDSTGSNVCLSVAEAWDYTSIYTDIANLYQDNCASPVTVTWLDSTNTPGNTDCTWSIKYRYTIEDDCSNSVIDSVMRSGGDTEAPALAGIDDCTTLDIDSVNECYSVALGWDASVLSAAVKALYDDNCDNDLTVTVTDTIPSGNDCAWSITYEYTIVDNCTNTTTCTVVRSGGDTLAPQLIGPDCSSLDLDSLNWCLSAVNDFDATTLEASVAALYTDNCDTSVSATFSGSNITGDDCNWTAVFTYNIVDNCSNAVFCDVTYSGGDTEAPTATAPADVTGIACIASIPAPDVSIITDEADNCGALIPVTKTFSSSDTWVVPAGVTSITVEARGGGGAGGGSTNAGFANARAGAGGGGGAYAMVNTLNVTPGSPLTITVAGTTAGVSGANGPQGGSTTIVGFESFIYAQGGFGGTANTSGGSPAGGLGGQAASSNGDIVTSGANGGAGATGSGVSSGAGGSGANGGGAGGASVGGTGTTANGNAGSPYGGGGSGSRTSQFGGAQTGGAGAAGYLTITYDSLVLPTVTWVNDVNNGGTSCPDDPYILTRTYQVTDACGNSTTVSHTYTVIMPDFTMPADKDSTISCINQAYQPLPPAVNNYCGFPVAISGPVFNSTPFNGCEGYVTYTWTYTDCGYTHDWVHTWTIERIGPAEVGGPVSTGTTVNCVADATETFTMPVIEDDCGAPLSPVGPAIGGSFNGCEGTYTYSYTYTDCANNQLVWVYTYTIDLPSFADPVDGSSTVACEALAIAPAPQDLPVLFDLCNNQIIPTGPVTGGSYVDCEGTIIYTWTYTDCAGNVQDWAYTYTIEVEDFTIGVANGGSTVDCPALTDSIPTPPTVLDNCGDTITPTGPSDSGQPACGGIRIYTWIYTDCEGNTHPWSYVYTVVYEDFSIAPDGDTIACPALAVQPPLPTITDNCGVVLSPTSPFGVLNADLNVIGQPYGCEGWVSYTWTYIDCDGNSHDYVFTYTIEREDFTMPNDSGEIITCSNQLDTPYYPPYVLSNCGDTLTPDTLIISPTPACNGDVTYVWTYSDCEGNTHDWTYTFTINDSIAPTAVTQNITAYLDSNGLVSIDAETQINNGSFDNCAPNPLTYSLDTSNFDCSDVGVHTVTLTVTDCAGNTDTATALVTVADEIYPVVTCPTDTVYAVDNGVCTYTVVGNILDPVVSDNCDIDTVYHNYNGGGTTLADSILTTGTYSITWTVEDVNGNVSTCIHEFDVEDQQAPIITILGTNPIQLCLDGPTYVDAGATADDNCDGDITDSIVTVSTVDISVVGSYTVTYTVTDANGNTATSIRTVNVVSCDISGNVKYLNNALDPLNNVIVQLYSGATPVAGKVDTTDANGDYTITAVAPGTYDVRFVTVKAVGGVNATDASLLNAWQTNVGPFNPLPIEKVRFLAADVALPDSFITSFDAFSVLMHFLNNGNFAWSNTTTDLWSWWTVGDSISINNWQQGRYPQVTIVNDDITANFYGLVSGDFNGSHTPSNAKVGGSIDINDGQSVLVGSNQEVELPLLATSGMNVGAISMVLDYPNDKVQVKGVYLDNDPNQPVFFTAANGTLRIAWTSLSPVLINAGEPLLTIQLTTADGLGKNEVIRFTMNPDPLCELADQNSMVIDNVLLYADVLTTSLTDVETKPVTEIGIRVYPNPFREQATIVCNLPQAGHVTLEVRNILGQNVSTLINSNLAAGSHRVVFNPGTLSSGVYTATLRVETEGVVETRHIRIVNQE